MTQEHDDQEGQEPFFSRPASSCPYGKCDEEAKAKVPELIKDLLTTVAFNHRQTPSEYLRDLIVGHLLGAGRVMRAQSTGLPEYAEPDFDQAINALSFAAGMDRKSYEQSVLKAHVIGLGGQLPALNTSSRAA